MTEVEFEKVCSIATSLEEIAEQMKIANKMKSKELEKVMQILASRESQAAIDMNAPINGDYPGKWDTCRV